MPNSTNHSAKNPFTNRQQKLLQALHEANLDALALNPGPSLTYLTGLHFHLSERPVIVIFSPNQIIHLVLPELEQAKLIDLPYSVKAYPYGEDPDRWVDSFRLAMQTAGLESSHIGVEPRRLRLLEFRLLLQAAAEAEFISAETSLAGLRMIKDPSEIMAMRKAAQIAQTALLATLPYIQFAISERDLASELTLQILRAGSDAEIPFAPIVSTGPNSANPHATPSDRLLQSGDLLVLDFGASYNGYFSDITRTFALGDIAPEYSRIAQVVLEANTASRSLARPGITAHELDQAARTVIDTAGYGAYFTHRTGHGLGLEGHEDPYIRKGNPLVLRPGMTFTIEPGIYFPQRNGVRIEDDVVITTNGMESLTDYPREVISLL
jgi:Xaa-Pro dipeptidase